MNYSEIIFFAIFLIFIIGILTIDLVVIGKNSHILKFKEALGWTVVWVSIAIAFYFFLQTNGSLIHGIKTHEDIIRVTEKYHDNLDVSSLSFDEAIDKYEHNLALEYITGYLIEYSLSVDNVFVMIMIFMSFGLNQRYYKRVLFWGILGAIIMRFIFIFVSAALIQRFGWLLYVFGGFLIFTGVNMFLTRNKEQKIDTQKHPVVRFASKYFGVFPRLVGQHFFVRKKAKVLITPLFIILLVIEFTDVVFAVDSVPAIFSVTRDPYIVFFSNIFAIIGLRSLFFIVANVMNLFRFLKIGLSVLLVFVGLKMIFHHFLDTIHFTTAHSLYVIIGILAISILASILIPPKTTT
jgi:tellurite resistance protein TerC